MSKIDVRLQYQKETGLNLTAINRIVDEPEFDNMYEKADHQAYVQWLEDNIIRLQRGVDAWESANIIATAAHKAVKKQK
jgi:hypothetical protein